MGLLNAERQRGFYIEVCENRKSTPLISSFYLLCQMVQLNKSQQPFLQKKQPGNQSKLYL